MGIDGQTTVGIFSRPGYTQKYLTSLTPPAINDMLRVPSDVGNKQFKFGGDPICHSGDICDRAEAGSIRRKSRLCGKSPDTTTA